MREKKEKEPQKRKPGRPRGTKNPKHEVLVVPKETLRMLRAIADEARLPLQLVYEDAILNGLSTLTGPEGMYASAIAFRKTRDRLIHETDRPVGQEPKVNGEKEPAPVSPTGIHDSEFSDVSGETEGTIDTSVDDLERRGLLPESIGDPEFHDEYAGEP